MNTDRNFSPQIPRSKATIRVKLFNSLNKNNFKFILESLFGLVTHIAVPCLSLCTFLLVL